jgi:3'(2'), 5'-bisphosphate nucleotidase
VQELVSLVDPLLELCREAGALICRHYHAPGTSDFEFKDDQSPLTLADTQSHALLQVGLRALDEQLPILSEESPPDALIGRRGWQRFWLVDPLDGTKEFLAGTGEFTINIALIDDHRPVLGVLYLPLEQTAFVGIPGLAAHRYHYRPQSHQWERHSLAVRALEPGRALAVLASRRHRNDRLEACLAWLRQRWQPVERLDSGSALKFCQLAQGAGDFYPRFSPCCEWDTAAGQAVLEAAGGALLGLDGRPLRYNCHESLYSPHFYAIADAGHPLWRDLLAERQL